MSIQYDYFKNPPRPGDEEEPMLHPRPIILSTLKTEDIATRLSAFTAFSSSDLKGILDHLAKTIFQGLSDGHNIYLEGIGTFSITLESRFVKNPEEIRAASIRVKNIEFRADKQLKRQLKAVKVKRVNKPRKSHFYTTEERSNRILQYIRENEMIHITKAMSLNESTHPKTKEDLEKLTEAGKIRKIKLGQRVVYVLKE